MTNDQDGLDCWYFYVVPYNIKEQQCIYILRFLRYNYCLLCILMTDGGRDCLLLPPATSVVFSTPGEANFGHVGVHCMQ